MNNSIIIAESSPTIAKLVAESCTAQGFRIQGIFNDGVSALRCANESPPAIVTIDLILPRLSGLQLAGALSKLTAPPLIIAISAVTARSRLAQAREAGVRYYILKPFSREKFGLILKSKIQGISQTPHQGEGRCHANH